MKKTLDELRADYAVLQTRAQTLVTRAGGGDLTGDDADEFDSVRADLDETRDEIQKIEQRTEAIKALAQHGTTEAGHPFGTPGGGNSLRDQGMRQLDRATKAGTLHETAAGTVENLIRSGGSWTQRWAAAAGSEAYERAFSKLVADPDRGHLTFEDDESRAYREVAQLQREQRAMGVGTGAGGGFMVPVVLDPAINLTSTGSVNPLRKLARVVQTTGSQWSGVTSAGVTAEWIGEAAEVADASPTLAQPNIPVFKADAFVPYSFELEGDGVHFINELRDLLIDGANQLTNAAYTTGNGTTQAKGLITALAAAGGSVVTGTGTEALIAADPYALQNALPPRFQPNAQWTANLSTINTMRQFETGSGALKFPDLQNSPPMLLGRRMNELSNMDGALNTAAAETNYLLVYGDFKQYVIVDRIGSTLEIVPHLVGANRRPTGQRGALLWFRTGSDVLVANAFRMLNVPTT